MIGWLEVSLLPFVNQAGLSMIDLDDVPIKVYENNEQEGKTDGKSTGKDGKDIKKSGGKDKKDKERESIDVGLTEGGIKEENQEPPKTHVKIELSHPLCKMIDLREWNVLTVAIGGLCSLPRVWEDKAKYQQEVTQRLIFIYI